MTLRVRGLSEEEADKLARMTRSHKLGAGLVRRAQIIQHAVDGLSAPGIAAKLGLCGATVRFWLKRFNERALDRLVAYLGEKGIGMKRSRVSEVLQAEGLRWRQEETWFGARVDPEFEHKRGRLSASTPPRPRAA
jgi:transposase